jgi:lysophospholipase L1-like esterase
MSRRRRIGLVAIVVLGLTTTILLPQRLPAQASLPAPEQRPITLMAVGDSIMLGSNEPGLRSEIFRRLLGIRPVRYVGIQSKFWNGAFDEEITNPSAPNNVVAAGGGLCLLADNQRGCGFNPAGPPAGILGLVKAAAEKGSVPDVFVVMAGINDRFCNLPETEINSIGVQPCVTPISKRFEVLFDEMFRINPRSLVVFSTGREFGRPENFFDEQRPSLEQLASNYRSSGREVFFVNAWDGITSAGMFDGVHPNETGAARMAENYVREMVPQLNRLFPLRSDGAPQVAPTTQATRKRPTTTKSKTKKTKKVKSPTTRAR